MISGLAAQRPIDETALPPFVKWAGGKRQLVSRIVPRLSVGPDSTYFEPFLGGGAIFFALAPKHAVIADTCDALVRTYRGIAAFPMIVGEALAALIQRGTDEEQYYAVRKEFGRPGVSDAVHAAEFIFLNRLCFNGLYRENRKGVFNVPWGRYRADRIRWITYDQLVRYSVVLQRATIERADFRKTLLSAKAGDVVYADPPYLDTFSNYAKDGFTEADHIDLAAQLHSLYQRGVTICASNNDTPLVRDLYRWATIEPVDEARAIAADESKRKAAPSLLIWGIR